MGKYNLEERTAELIRKQVQIRPRCFSKDLVSCNKKMAQAILRGFRLFEWLLELRRNVGLHQKLLYAW
jgi:hypothetical protein